MKNSNKILLILILLITLSGIGLFIGIIKRSGFIEKDNKGSFLHWAGNIIKFKKSIYGNGVRQSINAQLPDLKCFNINGAFRLMINYSDKNELIITGDENIIGEIRRIVSGNSLTLEVDENVRLRPQLALKIELYVKALNRININGSVETEINNITGEDLSLIINGASDTALFGVVDTFNLVSRGAGAINAKKLTADKVHIELLGAGSAIVTAENELEASIIGAGSVMYYGNPQKIKKILLGAGIMTAKN